MPLENAQKLAPNSPETLLALGYYQFRVLGDYELAKTTFERVNEMLPNSSEVPVALGRVTRREGHWDQSVAYFEQALALDPRNVKFLMDAAWTYAMLRQLPTALKLYDRALDIVPNDPDLMALKAGIYQAEGNLKEAVTLLSEINEKTPSNSFNEKVVQLRLERNYVESARLLQARLAQFSYDSDVDRAYDQMALALSQRLAGDFTGAKLAAEQARNTLEQLYKVEPDSALGATVLSQAYAGLGKKELAVKLADRAITLAAKDAEYKSMYKEAFALVQMTFGDYSGAISTLAHLLQIHYNGWFLGPAPITPALLRLDPLWDPLRGDPAFQKLCEEKQP